MVCIFCASFNPFWPSYSRKLGFGAFDQGMTRWVKFENSDLERVFRFGTLHQWCLKFLSKIFCPCWTSYRRKFWFGTFDQGATRWVKFENVDLERVFRFGTLHQWCVKFLSRIFYQFWLPYGQKFRFGTFNRVATKWYFDRGATISISQYLLSTVRLMGVNPLTILVCE